MSKKKSKPKSDGAGGRCPWYGLNRDADGTCPRDQGHWTPKVGQK